MANSSAPIQGGASVQSNGGTGNPTNANGGGNDSKVGPPPIPELFIVSEEFTAWIAQLEEQLSLAWNFDGLAKEEDVAYVVMQVLLHRYRTLGDVVRMRIEGMKINRQEIDTISAAMKVRQAELAELRSGDQSQQEKNQPRITELENEITSLQAALDSAMAVGQEEMTRTKKATDDHTEAMKMLTQLMDTLKQSRDRLLQ